ncbi:MAG TPA: YbaB/EbfC family nucleoid-associated protein [Candidatus Dojkabacteria bacterium]|nr:YbaB/EbfC family nucleoid-associated protein [Candidatus Dojkabacteria bacterium]HQG57477.1 YbaB/EbfC family nucleoid-associated protein [Candidatus Dojkabacteria bacterium]
MGNVFSQMKDLYKMQREAKDMQKKLRVEKIVGESDDSKVKLYMNGAQELEDIFIDDSLLHEGMLEVIKKGFKEAFKDYQKKLAKQLAGSFDVDELKRMMGSN